MTVSLAPIVRRRTPTWPTRWANYFDCTQWGGGYMRIGSGPGAAVLNSTTGATMNIQNGTVYIDERFKESHVR